MSVSKNRLKLTRIEKNENYALFFQYTKCQIIQRTESHD